MVSFRRYDEFLFRSRYSIFPGSTLASLYLLSESLQMPTTAYNVTQLICSRRRILIQSLDHLKIPKRKFGRRSKACLKSCINTFIEISFSLYLPVSDLTSSEARTKSNGSGRPLEIAQQAISYFLPEATSQGRKGEAKEEALASTITTVACCVETNMRSDHVMWYKVHPHDF